MSTSIANFLTITQRKVDREFAVIDAVKSVQNVNENQLYNVEPLSNTEINLCKSVNSYSRMLEIYGDTLDEMDEIETVNVITTIEDITPDEVYSMAEARGLYSTPSKLHKIDYGSDSSSGSSSSSNLYNDTSQNPPKRLHLTTVLGGGSSGSAGGATDPDEPINPDIPVEPDIPDVPDEPETPTTTVELIKKNASKNTVANYTVTSAGIILKLTDTDGTTYQYTIRPNNTSTTKITLEYLDNGRLVIQGDNINIVAKEGQKDNLIIFGNDNYIDTNSGDDTVRMGMVEDSYFYFMGDDYTKYYNVDSTGYLMRFHGNIIETGAGNDYVQNYGQNTINMGIGSQDALFDTGSWAVNYKTYSGVENIFAQGSINTISDNKLGWGMQNGFGDCKLLACLDSLCTNNKLSDYITITTTSTGYKVYFKKSGTTQYITNNDLQHVDTSEGDIDFKIIETAFRLLIEGQGYNMDGDDDSDYNIGLGYNNFLISNYLFGYNYPEGKYGQYYYEEDELTWMLQQYNNGNISQLVFCLDEDTEEYEKLGIYQGHAYALKGGVAGKYVEVTNPHDGKDIIRLDWSDFLDLFKVVILFGDAYKSYMTQYYPGMLSTPSNSSNVYLGEDCEPKAANLGVYSEISELEASIENIETTLNGTPKKLKLYS